MVADESVGRQIPIAFLERVKDDFVSKYGGGKAATAQANSLNKEFGYSILVKYEIHMLGIFLVIEVDIIYHSLQSKIESSYAVLC